MTISTQSIPVPKTKQHNSRCSSGPAANDGAHDLTLEFTAQVRTHAASRLELMRGEGPAALRIDERKIRIRADGNRALAGIQAEELRR